MPTCAIFSDTEDEEGRVYEWLEWLKCRLPFPVIRVSIGKLSMAATAVRVSKSGNKYLRPGIPVFFKDGEGRGNRQCTKDFKLIPIQRYAKLIRGDSRVVMWIGISTDEKERAKESREEWCDNRFPLLEKRLSREQCIAWMREKGYPDPPDSACVYCPFRSNARWARMKTQRPVEFAKAVGFERDYQAAAVGVLENTPFLHRSCVPLDQVDFADPGDPQSFLWQDECEGMCGL